MDELLADLAAENAALDRIVADLPDAGWDRPTPADGWMVRDQISHLAFFDHAGTQAITDPERYQAGIPAVLADPEGYQRRGHVEPGRAMSPAELLDWWRRARDGLAKALATRGTADRVPWAGSVMAVRSFTSARFMEVWAHGQDVADAVGAPHEPSDRVRHVCHLGARTLPHAFRAHGLEPPAQPPRFDLTLPSGITWSLEEAGEERVSGDAVEFGLLVTQRRHRADTGLVAVGEHADRFLDIAQAFAGPPGPGRRPSR